MRRGIFCLVFSSLGLASCAVGPNFRAPGVTSPTAYAEADGRTSTNQPAINWWKSFGDPVLDHLIEEALERNYDLRIAGVRIREARAQRNVTSADLFPDLDATAGYNHARGSKNVELPLGGQSSGGGASNQHGKQKSAQARGSSSTAGAQNLLSPLGAGGLPGVTTDLFQAGFDANWELDVFGGTRRQIEAANADLAASVENRNAVTVTLLAEVARDYLELRAAQERLQVARKNLATEKELLDLVRDRRKQGFVTDLDVTRAAGDVSTTAALLPPLQAQARRSLHALAVLLARNPGELGQELETSAPIPATPPEVPVGLPSDLLLRRPDIRRSLLQIHAANARIGAATADLFPKFALTGSVGFDASRFTKLFSWDSHYFLISPSVSWPVFDAGRIVSNISLQKANTAEAVLAYKKSILVALQEVEDALVSYNTELARTSALRDALKQNQEALTIARLQYRQGLTTFLDVLEAQRTVLSTEDAVVQSRAASASNLVALYKALGGGWQSEATQQASAR
jgi:NodT family efflux transporter outer membrane factor (OMF) lipoprotein